MSKYYYFLIIFILNLNSYMYRIFSKHPNIEIILDTLNNIKKIDILFLLIFTFMLFFSKNKMLKSDIKTILTLIFFSIFLKNFYLSFLVTIISNYVNKKFRLKSILLILVSFYILVLIFHIFGYLEFNNISSGIRKFENFEVYRRTLGFNNPNAAMALLLPIFSLIYYLYYPNYKKIILSIILSVGSIIFSLTFSRTTFLLLILFVVLILLKDKYIKKLKFLFLTGIFFIVFFTLYLPFYFRHSILNKLLSSRLSWFYYYLVNYSVTLFGDVTIREYYKRQYLDNIYLKTLFENGIIGLILLISLIFIIMYILFKNEDYKAVRIFSIILIFGFMESSAFFHYFNIIYFIIPDYIFKDKKKIRRIRNENNSKKNIIFY